MERLQGRMLSATLHPVSADGHLVAPCPRWVALRAQPRPQLSRLVIAGPLS